MGESIRSSLTLVPVYTVSIFALPFPNWTSFRIALTAAATARNVTIHQRASMIWFLSRELLTLPIWATFWLLDELLYPQYHNEKIREPIFIISQPRSGTTFLLRTLSEDKNTFLSVKHFEWRYPYISFWRMAEFLGIREWFERQSYWPNTKIGRKCEKIHNHVLGNYEEFGIFLEERFYHHYFVFRRFPFNAVMERVSQFDTLSDNAKARMITTFLRVVKKVYFHRGNGEIFLAKENENVEFCRAALSRLEGARVLMICRDPQPMLNSYLTMSITCTKVKHGVDPTIRGRWHNINTDFRREQCRKFIQFWNDIRHEKTSILIAFDDFTTAVLDTTRRIYKQYELPISLDFLAYLETTQAEQSKRVKGYKNMQCVEEGFEFYRKFVEQAKHLSEVSK